MKDQIKALADKYFEEIVPQKISSRIQNFLLKSLKPVNTFKTF